MRFVRPASLLLASAVLVAACAGTGVNQTSRPTAAGSPASSTLPSVTPGMSHAMASPSASSRPPASAAVLESAAGDLRTDLNLVLGEHLILASKATGAALGGRADEFAAYGDLLNANGTDLGEMIGAAFGAEAKDSFNKIWSAHNGFFVDYTTGVAKSDKTLQDKAVQDLNTVYVPQFSELLSGATGLPLEAVKTLVTEHVGTTIDIIDAQASKDWIAAYAAIRTAYAHMQMLGDPLAQAIAAKKPDLFAGDSATKGVSFRVALNGLLQEHLYLASYATGTALGGRNDEFAAAGDALNANGTDLGAAIGSLYGDAAKDAFNKIWSAHNGFFVDYTTGVAKGDRALQDKAVQDLTTIYVPQFSEFLAGATGLPLEAVGALTTEHVLTTKAIVDAQGAKDAQASATADRTAGQHMQMIGDPLAKAIIEKLPEKFTP